MHTADHRIAQICSVLLGIWDFLTFSDLNNVRVFQSFWESINLVKFYAGRMRAILSIISTQPRLKNFPNEFEHRRLVSNDQAILQHVADAFSTSLLTTILCLFYEKAKRPNDLKKSFYVASFRVTFRLRKSGSRVLLCETNTCCLIAIGSRVCGAILKLSSTNVLQNNGRCQWSRIFLA